MKKRSFLLFLAGVVVGSLLILTACSNMPITQPENIPGIKLCQAGREADSLLANIMTIFVVTVPEGSNPISYAWDFGDTTSSVITNIPQVEHRYIAAGNYVARVVVTYADGGSTTYSRNVRVYVAGSSIG